VYGIDMPSPDELIAHGRTEEEVCREIGADWLVFQDLGDLIEAIKKGNNVINSFDASVFTGDYVTGDIGDDYLNDLQASRSDAAKHGRRKRDDEVIDLHNSA
jgi:amidophosphoribosyltransferase